MLDLTDKNIKAQNGTAVALGVFDGVHIGHRAVISAAVNKCADGLSPAIFTFKSPSVTTKGDGRVLYTDEKKRECFESLGVEILYSPEFSKLCDMSAERFVNEILAEKLCARAVCCGESFRFGKNALADVDALKKMCAERGMEVTVVSPVNYGGETVSSTRIKNSLAKGDIKNANAMLSEELSYELPVVHGRQLGRTLNFPTVNQQLPTELVLPRFGVYLTRVYYGGKQYRGVSNIGVKPTVGAASPLIETHILGLCEDLYGKVIKVSLVDFIRPERKFESIEALKRCVDQDIENAQKGSF